MSGAYHSDGSLWGVGFLKGRSHAFSRCFPPHPNTAQLEWDDPNGLGLKRSRGCVSTETNDSNSLRFSVDGCSRFPERSGRTCTEGGWAGQEAGWAFHSLLTDHNQWSLVPKRVPDRMPDRHLAEILNKTAGAFAYWGWSLRSTGTKSTCS